MRKQIFTNPRSQLKFKRIVIRETMVLVVMALIMATLWLAGNYIIASRYKPEFAGVQKELAQLDANKQSAIKEAAKEKVLVFTKIFFERYDPKKEKTESVDELLRIYYRYAADDNKFLRYLFKNYLPNYSFDTYKEEIAAFEKDASVRADAQSDKIMAAYNAKGQLQLKIQDKMYEDLIKAYRLHNLIMILLLVLVYPVRYIIYLLQWAIETLKHIDRNLLR
jgi:hypothetical protein